MSFFLHKPSETTLSLEFDSDGGDKNFLLKAIHTLYINLKIKLCQVQNNSTIQDVIFE